MKTDTSPHLEIVSSQKQKPLTVLLAGASGLIGSNCLELLLANPNVKKVIAPTRRTLVHTSDKLRNVLVDFDRLDEYPELFQCDAIICCLGTTIRQAGSKDAFKRVDLQYCLDLATLGRSHTAKAYYLVSAIGADASSWFFYSRVKGELERRLIQLEYDYLSLYRPSLLMGDRKESRLGESLGIKAANVINPFLSGAMAQYKAINAKTVAQAIVNECTLIGEPQERGPRVNIYTHNKIVTLAKQPKTLIKGN